MKSQIWRWLVLLVLERGCSQSTHHKKVLGSLWPRSNLMNPMFASIIGSISKIMKITNLRNKMKACTSFRSLQSISLISEMKSKRRSCSRRTTLTLLITNSYFRVPCCKMPLKDTSNRKRISTSEYLLAKNLRESRNWNLRANLK